MNEIGNGDQAVIFRAFKFTGNGQKQFYKGMHTGIRPATQLNMPELTQRLGSGNSDMSGNLQPAEIGFLGVRNFQRVCCLLRDGGCIKFSGNFIKAR